MNSDKRSKLIRKYDVTGSRYTLYTAVPYWKNEPLFSDDWFETIHRNQNHFFNKNVSIYVHLPYCESLCTFCGCHRRITKNHTVEEPHIDAVIKEWELSKVARLEETQIKELYFGGGTPMFFVADELVRLVTALLKDEQVAALEVEMGFELHPNSTNEEHLKKLNDLGFKGIVLEVTNI